MESQANQKAPKGAIEALVRRELASGRLDLESSVPESAKAIKARAPFPTSWSSVERVLGRLRKRKRDNDGTLPDPTPTVRKMMQMLADNEGENGQEGSSAQSEKKGPSDSGSAGGRGGGFDTGPLAKSQDSLAAYSAMRKRREREFEKLLKGTHEASRDFVDWSRRELERLSDDNQHFEALLRGTQTASQELLNWVRAEIERLTEDSLHLLKRVSDQEVEIGRLKGRRR